MEDELHELDRRIEQVRRRIWQIRQGVIAVEDPDGEVARLDAEYQELGDRFVEAYREWSKRSDT
jgi:hypothetical protein